MAESVPVSFCNEELWEGKCAQESGARIRKFNYMAMGVEPGPLSGFVRWRKRAVPGRARS